MKKLFALFIVLALPFTLPLAADTITLESVSGASQGGVYTLPYFLSIDGAGNVAAMCVDFSHHVSIGESWDANISAMTSGDLANTRLGDSGYTTYREEAWLFSEFMAGAGPSGDINYAAWALTTPSVMSSSGWTAGAQQWYNLATSTDLANFSTVNFAIITPNDLTPGGSQEFITETPEPAGLLLVGSGLLGLAGFGKKKLRKAF